MKKTLIILLVLLLSFSSASASRANTLISFSHNTDLADTTALLEETQAVGSVWVTNPKYIAQQTSAGCVVASCAMVAATYKARLGQELSYTYNGTKYTGFWAVYYANGGRDSMTWSNMKKFGLNDGPAIISSNSGSSVYNGKYNSAQRLEIIVNNLSSANNSFGVLLYFQPSSTKKHAVVAVGYENGVLYVNDPARNGGGERIPLTSYYYGSGKTQSQIMNDLSFACVFSSLTPMCSYDHLNLSSATYEGCGLCKGCGYKYPWESTRDRLYAGEYIVSNPFTPRVSEPYSDADSALYTNAPGKVVQVRSRIKNAYGNYWYEILDSDGKYVYVFGDGYLSFRNVLSSSINGVISAPIENQVVPQATYNIVGTITSDIYPLDYVRAYIDGSSSPYATVSTGNVFSYSLKTSDINYDLAFAGLSIGKHTIRIEASDVKHDDYVSVITRNFYVGSDAIAPTTQASIGASPISASQASTISIPVVISDNPGIMGYRITVTYDPNIFTTPLANRGDLTQNGSFNTTIDGAEYAPGSFDVLWNTDANVTGDGSLFIISLNVVNSVMPSSTAINLSYSQSDTFNEQYQGVLLNCKEIVINLSSCKYGDTNGDDEVGNKDVAYLARYLVGKETMTAIQLLAADTNGDGEVGNKDVAYLARYLVGKENGPGIRTMSTNQNKDIKGQAVLGSDPVECKPGDTISVPFILTGNTGIMGMRATISYDSEAFLSPIVERGTLSQQGNFNTTIGGDGYTPGNFDILWNADSNVTGDGSIFIVKFTVGELADGEYILEIAYTQSDTFNENWEDVVLTCNPIIVNVIDSSTPTPKPTSIDTADLFRAITYVRQFIGSDEYNKCSEELQKIWEEALVKAVQLYYSDNKTQTECDDLASYIFSLSPTGQTGSEILIGCYFAAILLCGIIIFHVQRRRYLGRH